jgi:hypothetical protein
LCPSELLCRGDVLSFRQTQMDMDKPPVGRATTPGQPQSQRKCVQYIAG